MREEGKTYGAAGARAAVVVRAAGGASAREARQPLLPKPLQKSPNSSSRIGTPYQGSILKVGKKVEKLKSW